MTASQDAAAVIEGVIRCLVHEGIADSWNIRGCDEAEVRTVEAKAGAPLPESYRQFLLRLGWSAGCLFRGTDMLYPSVLNLRDWAEELLREDGAGFCLPGNAFVFSMHQGYQFLYFPIDPALPDPPVYHYFEGDGVAKEVAPSFSAYLRASVADHVRLKASRA